MRWLCWEMGMLNTLAEDLEGKADADSWGEGDPLRSAPRRDMVRLACLLGLARSASARPLGNCHLLAFPTACIQPMTGTCRFQAEPPALLEHFLPSHTAATAPTSFYRLTLFASVITVWENTDRNIETLQQLIHQMIESEKFAKGSIASSVSSVFERDPGKSKEAEDLIEYIERFNELFSRGQYEAAATYAANCPRGILRNEETLEKFRAVGRVKGKILPLLLYCDALITTTIAIKKPLPANLTTEAIKCALAEKRLDLVMHWITLHKLEFSEAAGDAIFKYADVDTHNKSQCLALAQIAYSECGAHKKAVLCLCKQGQIYGAMDYLHHFKLLSTEDYIFLLKHCPRIDFIHCLTQEWNGKPPIMSLGETILSLIGTEHEIHGIHLLEDITKKGKDTLEQIIVNDTSNVEGWKEIAETCLLVKKEHLYKLIISVLASLEGVFEIPTDDSEDAKLMEHVFL